MHMHNDFRDSFTLYVSILLRLHGTCGVQTRSTSCQLCETIKFQPPGFDVQLTRGIFVICYGIYLRCGFVYIFTQKSCNDFQYKTLVLVLNSGINPLAYAFFKRDLKKKIKRLL
ncbi:unnamed protein product [Porites evermanni]|uniref:G-protein coupled receptors family 1 profile domain-containing protein n=1 Tax=Porites evermanni TaxID=104178 RepID=A0ABN8LVT0_9CNID|nr:unnamed protein product [Porites evermanni]